ncbi:hypothetical protein [Aeromonas sp. L_1B5_3]|uniref:hypothetical protein n=2 Tax=unclassified Aeromonas TaxID=257493 RepID=UPI0012E0C113|nr:hypothetical protein [Aeromonas sp. L_1B5_3]
MTAPPEGMMSPLQLLDDLLDLVDFITDFPRFWRVYVGLLCTLGACALVARTRDSPDGLEFVFGVIVVLGIGLTLLWQRAAR